MNDDPQWVGMFSKGAFLFLLEFFHATVSSIRDIKKKLDLIYELRIDFSNYCAVTQALLFIFIL